MSARARHRRPDQAVAPSGQRHDWVDAGRGVAIILVVLVHSRDWLDTAGLNLGVWEQVNNVLAALRMPLFLTIPGLLGAKWVTARWPRLLSQKITVLVWVYLLWQPIGLLAALVADRITGAHQGLLHFVIALAATVVRPRSELWFLWALTLYFVLAGSGPGPGSPPNCWWRASCRRSGCPGWYRSAIRAGTGAEVLPVLPDRYSSP
jgi:uncharacterized membrane protein YcfT